MGFHIHLYSTGSHIVDLQNSSALPVLGTEQPDLHSNFSTTLGTHYTTQHQSAAYVEIVVDSLALSHSNSCKLRLHLIDMLKQATRSMRMEGVVECHFYHKLMRF